MIFSELLDAARWDGKAMSLAIPPEWAQGRTAYGGLTAALCAHCAGQAVEGLPPLRSAQVAFVGPAAGAVEIRAEVLRRGKSTAFVQVDLAAEKGLATRATLIYGAGRESEVAFSDRPMADVPDPDALDPMIVTPQHPAFLEQFDIRPASGGMPFMGMEEHEMNWWVRHRDANVRGTEVALLAIGDVTPPAAAPLMKTFAPVSSVNWHIDLLTDDLETEDGWFLLHTRAEAAKDGWSGQEMALWSRNGRPVAGARQSVVIFA